jgi:hypothetical protein
VTDVVRTLPKCRGLVSETGSDVTNSRRFQIRASYSHTFRLAHRPFWLVFGTVVPALVCTIDDEHSEGGRIRNTRQHDRDEQVQNKRRADLTCQ